MNSGDLGEPGFVTAHLGLQGGLWRGRTRIGESNYCALDDGLCLLVKQTSFCNGLLKMASGLLELANRLLK